MWLTTTNIRINSVLLRCLCVQIIKPSGAILNKWELEKNRQNYLLTFHISVVFPTQNKWN